MIKKTTYQQEYSNEKCVLQKDSRFSESIVWELLRDFYLQTGEQSWQSYIVPTFITSNNFIARQYARLIVGALHDFLGGKAAKNVNFKRPIYFMELGCGSGKLSFLILKYLFEWEDQWPESDLEIPFKLIITDLSEKNVQFCRNHRCMQEFIERNAVDFAVLDVQFDHNITLLGPPGKDQQEGLPIRFFDNPVVFFGNYFFDSLPHDAFQVSGGVLQEAVLTVTSKNSWEPDLKDISLMRRCDLHWKLKEIDPETRYTGRLAPLGKLLQYYAESFGEDDASFLMPTGPFLALRLCQQLSQNQFIFISGDKCYSRESEFQGLRDPHVANHGTFSVMANLHAIMMWFENNNGFANCTQYLEGYKTCFCGMGVDWSSLKQAVLAFDDINNYGPEAFSHIQRSAHKQIEDMDMKLILFLLRMSSHDSTVFAKLHEEIYTQIREQKNLHNFSASLIEDLVNDLQVVYEMHYPIHVNPQKDICNFLARIFCGLRKYDLAIAPLLDSVVDFGPNVNKFSTLGTCLYNVGHLDNALESFEEALAIDPDDHESLHGKKVILDQLKLKNIV